MKAIVLAAGEGRRLRPFTETMPKVMLPVSNKPILEYVFDAVKKSGIDDIIVVVGYKKEVIMEYFKDYEDVNLTYVVQDKQLGTAHALLQAKKHSSDPFILLSGDNIIDRSSISKLIKNKLQHSILIKEHPHPSKYGMVLVEKDILKGIFEKPKEEKGRYISTGIYKLPGSIFKKVEELTSQGVYAFTSVIQLMVTQGAKIGTVTADLWRDIVYPWDLIDVNEDMIRTNSSSVGGVIEKGVTIKGNVSVGDGTTIYSGCYIVGPAVIGENCEIGPNTCIFPSTTIGNNSNVHPFSEIRHSLIMDEAHIGSNSFISHSIVGRGTVIGPGFSTIAGRATIEVEDEFRKLSNLGAMIGENCNIGNNVVVESGIIIGRGCLISSNNRVITNLSSQSKVI